MAARPPARRGQLLLNNRFPGCGGERIIAAPRPIPLSRPRQAAGAGGQFGAALHATVGDADLGFYALRYNARSPVVTTAGCFGGCDMPGQVGAYRLVYARGINIFGASASTFLGNDNIAGEISFRQNAPLLAAMNLGSSPVPRGDTVNGQVSIVAERPASALWDRVTLSAELAGNTLLERQSTQEGATRRRPVRPRPCRRSLRSTIFTSCPRWTSRRSSLPHTGWVADRAWTRRWWALRAM